MKGKLILTRRVGERLMINGDEIIIEVLAIKGNQVSLGIAAPKEVSVHREEIYHKINYDRKTIKDQPTENSLC